MDEIIIQFEPSDCNPTGDMSRFTYPKFLTVTENKIINKHAVEIQDLWNQSPDATCDVGESIYE